MLENTKGERVRMIGDNSKLVFGLMASLHHLKSLLCFVFEDNDPSSQMSHTRLWPCALAVTAASAAQQQLEDMLELTEENVETVLDEVRSFLKSRVCHLAAHP